jgi:type IV secretion system protein VirD4
MTDLLLGWPVDGERQKVRRSLGARSSSRYTDISRIERYNQDGHLVTFAPTGAGKGVSVIIPNLLHYDGPVITIDPKGENFAVTARYRKYVLGQKIVLLDPFEHVPDEILQDLEVARARFNPLDLIAADPKLDIQATMLAAVFSGKRTDRASSSQHDFWDNEALKLLAGVLSATVAVGSADDRTPGFGEFLNKLYSDDVAYNLAVTLDKQGNLIGPFAYKCIAAFLQKADKERSGVLSTAQSYLNPLVSDHINKFMKDSTFGIRHILGEDNYTVYLVIPPSKLVSHSVLLRIWIACTLTLIMERKSHPKQRTLFLLDECAQLGYLEGLKKAITLLRGYGLQVWMFFQDLTQIQTIYDNDSDGMINNCGIVQCFGMGRNLAAKPIAEMIGRFSVDQLVQLSQKQQVISVARQSPRLLRSCIYYSDRAFADRWDSNPLRGEANNEQEPIGFSPNLIKTGAASKY